MLLWWVSLPEGFCAANLLPLTWCVVTGSCELCARRKPSFERWLLACGGGSTACWKLPCQSTEEQNLKWRISRILDAWASSELVSVFRSNILVSTCGWEETQVTELTDGGRQFSSLPSQVSVPAHNAKSAMKDNRPPLSQLWAWRRGEKRVTSFSLSRNFQLWG